MLESLIRLSAPERPRVATPILGVSFSHRQAELLGLDPDEVFHALLNDLRVRRFRLSAYWDEIQPEGLLAGG